jgi:hypothetical protein
MHDDDKRLALMFREDGTRLEPMWIPAFKTCIYAAEKPEGWDIKPVHLSFRYAMVTLGHVTFYLEEGKAKPWTKELQVSPEFLADSDAFSAGLLSLATPDEAVPGTSHLWCMRVLPPNENTYDDYIRIWLCGSAVRAVNERQG